MGLKKINVRLNKKTIKIKSPNKIIILGNALFNKIFCFRK